MNRTANFLRSRLPEVYSKRHKAYLGKLKDTMNDLPTPQGSFKADYDAKQRKYNLQLLAGITCFVGVIAGARATGHLYLNFSPPAKPGPKVIYERNPEY